MVGDFSRFICALRSIGGTIVHQFNHEAPINHENRTRDRATGRMRTAVLMSTTTGRKGMTPDVNYRPFG